MEKTEAKNIGKFPVLCDEKKQICRRAESKMAAMAGMMDIWREVAEGLLLSCGYRISFMLLTI